MVLMLLGLALLRAGNLSAYPVFFFIQTVGTVVNGGPDLLGLNGQPVTVSASIDTTAIPISSGVNCTAGTNCNTYNVPSVALGIPGVSITILNVPLTITVNTATAPDTLSASLTVPFFGTNIPVVLVIGIPAGTISAPTPDGLGIVHIVAGVAPYTFGSVLTYDQGTNTTQLTLTGTVDGVNILHTFSGTGTGTDGGFPQSTLTQTALKKVGVGTFAGTFSGTTFGAALQGLASTVFSVTNDTTKTDSLKTLHPFSVATEGTGAEGALLQATNGLLYGVTSSGGAANTGTIFYTAPGSTSVTPVNQSLPEPMSLIEGSDSFLYGVTRSTTAANSAFKLSLAGGTPTILHTFTTEGIPSGPLVQASDGNLYGETTGGTTGFGMLYRMTKAGVLTPLYTFTNSTDGKNPSRGLFQASNGHLYGVAAGGAHGSGVIFSIPLAGGTPTTVHAFRGPDGAMPSGGLIQATDNNLYGVTSAGGATNLGTVFRVSLANPPVFRLVHNFSGTDGQQPNVPGPGLELGSDGKIYGTASSTLFVDGSIGGGTVFSLDLKLPKPKPAIVRFSPTSGPVGTTVHISGRNLLGVQKVTFNGTAATVIHSMGATYLTAVVPTGATTGPIAVTTPNGTATSTAVFTVQ